MVGKDMEGGDRMEGVELLGLVEMGGNGTIMS